MAFIPVPNTAMAELVFDWRGQTVENTLWFENVLPFGTTDLDLLITGLIDWWTTELRVQMTGDVILKTVRATAMDSSTAPSSEFSPSSGNVGTAAGASVENAITWALQFKTALRGRSFRGRNYFIGIPESVRVSGNYLQASYAFALVGSYAQLMNATYVGSNVWVVVSRFTGGAARSAGVTTPVTSVGYADLVLDVQRRRLPGRGN